MTWPKDGILDMNMPASSSCELCHLLSAYVCVYVDVCVRRLKDWYAPHGSLSLVIRILRCFEDI